MEGKRGRGALKGSHSKRRKPLEGKTIGNWKVVSYHGMIDAKKSAYLCECTLCGNTKLVRADKLMAGKSMMCMDCRRKQGGKKNEV